MPSRLGALAGRYILTRLLGEDEAVSTFEGLDSEQDWPVLIKLLPRALADDPARRQQLERLAERLIALEHPNLLSIVEAGLEEGVPYLIAQGIAATPLAERMGQVWDVDQVAHVITQVGEALTYAYRQGVIHGNLTPQNVLLAAGDHVLLSDLGLESVLETPWEQVQEALAPYLSPERIRGWLPDARADVYAVGTILYEMLTGLQLDGPIEQALPWLHEIVPDIASDLEPVLVRALATDPQARYATVGEFMADLKPILSGYVSPQEPIQPAKPAPQPAPAPVETPPPHPVPIPTFIAPALEGIPAIPMPEPPPMPTFDWDAFSLQLATLPLPEPPPPPEPPPLPKITAEGIEFPTVASGILDGLPSTADDRGAEEAPPRVPRQQKRAVPARKATRPVRRTPQPSSPATTSTPSTLPSARSAPQLRLSEVSLARLGRPLRIVFLIVAILFLMLSCCCLSILFSDVNNVENTPASYDVPLTPAGFESGVLLATSCPHDWALHCG